MTVGVAGVQVAIDRATGKLRPPTPEETKALAVAIGKLANRSTEGLTAVDRPGGAKSIDLKGRFMSVAVASLTTDGNASAQCQHAKPAGSAPGDRIQARRGPSSNQPAAAEEKE